MKRKYAIAECGTGSKWYLMHLFPGTGQSGSDETNDLKLARTALKEWQAERPQNQHGIIVWTPKVQWKTK